jgi:hypothetical protein
VPHATPTFLYAEFEGAVSLVESYLANPYDEVRFLSIGGPAEAVKAVLAAAKLKGNRLSLFRRKSTRASTRTGAKPSGRCTRP